MPSVAFDSGSTGWSMNNGAVDPASYSEISGKLLSSAFSSFSAAHLLAASASSFSVSLLGFSNTFDEGTAEELEGATLDIYDVTGSLVEHVTTVDPVTYLSGFKASGTYFGRLMMANGETKTVKFVIVK